MRTVPFICHISSYWHAACVLEAENQEAAFEEENATKDKVEIDSYPTVCTASIYIKG